MVLKSFSGWGGGVGGATAYLGGATAYVVGGATAYLGGAPAYMVGGKMNSRIKLTSAKVGDEVEAELGKISFECD